METVIVDGKEISKQDLQKLKEELASNKKKKLKEVEPNKFKTLTLMEG